MTRYCSVTADMNRSLFARVWPFAAGLLLLSAATGLVRAQDLGEASPVPISLTTADAGSTSFQDRVDDVAGMGLQWRPQSGLDFHGGFRLLRPAAAPFSDPACRDGSSAFACRPAWGPPMADIADSGGHEATVGGQWRPLERLRFGVDLYSRESANPGALLLPQVLDFIAPGWEDSLSRGIKDGEGVDLSVAYGFDAGVIGELELQVELSHVLNQHLSRAPQATDAVFGLAGQPENQASVGFNWSRGDFSGSVSSHYTDGIMLNGQVHPAAWTTVDINFAWRTPWNASLSLGAQNFLGQDPAGPEFGVDASTPPELDSAFSRVPYVRYEQDL